MALVRVTAIVWWKMGISHYKAVFRRARGDEESSGYTKDFLQAPIAISDTFREMFGGRNPPYEPLRYVWTGGQFAQGRIYEAADYDHAAGHGRLEVGQWTAAGAPRPWRVDDPSADPLITLPGDPEAAIPDEASSQWEILEELEPWLMMVQLDGNQEELHLRAYLGNPPLKLMAADLARVPEPVRVHMSGQGGLAGDEVPELWFDPDDYRDPWRNAPEDEGREAERASRSAAAQPAETVLGIDYRPANETATSIAPEPFSVDPDERDRATRAHAATQNALAGAVRERGGTPRSPRGEPSYDLCWDHDGVTIVAEVKSITARNEERQLRLGLGQVLRYRSLLEANGRPARALIALSGQPSDERWLELCAALDVGLVWAPDLERGLAAWLD
jgi:hypothetical protein